MCTSSRMSWTNIPIFHFWNFCVCKIQIKIIKNYLSKKTHDVSWCRQFCSFFSRCHDLKTCSIIVFIANLLVRKFTVQANPNLIFAKVDRDFVFYFFIFVLLVLFFLRPEGIFFRNRRNRKNRRRPIFESIFKIKKVGLA